MNDSNQRCPWAIKPLDAAYHDEEWGVPERDSLRLFEMINLEGAQAGLSWSTILAKREGYRSAFANWDPEVIASFGEDDVASLMLDAGIVRNRLKIHAVITNARAFLEVESQEGFSALVWNVVGNVPIQNAFQSLSEVPARTEQSDQLSKLLLKRGFKFVGTTICYAFMQACGMTNDHLVSCPQYEKCRKGNLA